MYSSAGRFFSLFLLLSSFALRGQNLTKSPYSIIGIGDLQFLGTAQQSGMGQVGLGGRKSAEINMLNPASFSGLKYTVIEGALTYGVGTLNKGNQSSKVDNSSFSYFMFGVPLHAKLGWGMVFGISPYSNIGYNVSSTKTYPDFVGTTQFVGSGGLSRFHFGTGIKIIKNLSVGINASYLFGQTTTEQKLIIPPIYNKLNIAETRDRTVGGTQLQTGIQYHTDFLWGKEKYVFVAGATYTLGADIDAKEKYFVRSLGVGQTLGVLDTIAYNNKNVGVITLPASYAAGISLEKKEKWMIAVDVNLANWENYRSFGSTDSLRNSVGFAIGGSYVPNASDYKHYFNRIEYRIGGRYDNGTLIIANKSIATYAVSAGMGFPLGKSKTRLNISGEYIVRGTLENDLIQEQYFRFILGINFSDKWFQRYKYD